MSRVIIFDFNRTLYNPDVDRLLPQARRVLSVLQRRGCRLYLVSRKEQGRERRIRETGIADYFSEISVVSRKGRSLFSTIVAQAGVPADEVLVVGDSLSDEIALANAVGCRTVRLRAGKFASQEPSGPLEVPDVTITSLVQLLPLAR